MNRQVARTRKLMLDAAIGLLADEGPDAVTHLRVAEAAEVARATVYRHWSDPTDLLLATLVAGGVPNIPTPSEDLPLPDAVNALLGGFAEALNSDKGKTIATLIGRSEWEEWALVAKSKIADAGLGMLVGMLEAAVASGELVGDPDCELLADRLAGPLYARRLVRHQPIPDGYVERLVDVTLTPLLVAVADD